MLRSAAAIALLCAAAPVAAAEPWLQIGTRGNVHHFMRQSDVANQNNSRPTVWVLQTARQDTAPPYSLTLVDFDCAARTFRVQRQLIYDAQGKEARVALPQPEWHKMSSNSLAHHWAEAACPSK